MMDVSVVQAANGEEDVREVVSLAKEKHFKAVHVLPNWVPLLSELLIGSNSSLVGSSTGFPSGGSRTETKLFEARQLIADGVQEIDMMMNVGRLKSGHYTYVENEIRSLKNLTGEMTLKVILETCELTDDEIKKSCELAIVAGANYVKTSSGWGRSGATLEVVALITSFVGDSIQVKASGGIRILDTVVKMYKMGVRRFGVNMESSVKIMSECDALPGGKLIV
jgi:deoxyribose-phosphate aldolase